MQKRHADQFEKRGSFLRTSSRNLAINIRYIISGARGQKNFSRDIFSRKRLSLLWLAPITPPSRTFTKILIAGLYHRDLVSSSKKILLYLKIPVDLLLSSSINSKPAYKEIVKGLASSKSVQNSLTLMQRDILHRTVSNQ